MEDEDLTVAVHAAADADGDALHLLGDDLGELAGNGFEDDGEGSGFVEGDGVLDHSLGGVEGLALYLESAEGSGGLGSEPYVSEGGDARLDDG